MNTTMLASAYSEFEVAMDQSLYAKTELNGILETLIIESEAETDDEREAIMTVIAGMLATYRGTKAIEASEMNDEDKAIAQKGVLNSIQYAKGIANKSINKDIEPGGTLVKITKFTNRPKIAEGRLTEAYQMAVEISTKPEPSSKDDMSEDSDLSLELPEMGLEQMMEAVIERFGMNTVANYIIKRDDALEV